MITGVEIYWLEQTEPDLPESDDWLSRAEKAHLATLRVPKRRSEWRLGRWTAKRAVAEYLDLGRDLRSLATIEIRASQSGAPAVHLSDRAAPPAVSLSHRDGRAACAIAPAKAEIGCDLEVVELHSDAFIADYFTRDEQLAIRGAAADERALMVALIWSAKESALKALQEGLRLDTRSVEVTFSIPFRSHTPQQDEWQPLSVQYIDRRSLQGWWRREDRFVGTIVSSPQPARPRVWEPHLTRV